MKTIALLSLIAATTAFAGEPATKPNKDPTGDQALTSEVFVQKAAQAGMLEVEAGKLAVSQGASDDVKTFGQKMITDHGKANSELLSIAGPTQEVPKQLDAEHQAKLDALKKKHGAQFDKAYDAEMQADHKKAIALFTQASTAPSVSPELQQFARKTLPVLEQHHSLTMTLPGVAANASK